MSSSSPIMPMRYLANDMQFFVTTPFIIFAMWKSTRLGVGLLSTLLVIFTAIPTALAFIDDWGFTTVYVGGGNPLTSPTPFQNAFFWDFYVLPWCR
jgi:hypothetical protein